MAARGSLDLVPVLTREHARQPFLPSAPREAARRVAVLAAEVGLDARVMRGGVDVGPVEVDHLWVLAEGRLVDVSLPLLAPMFRRVLLSWVAGDADDTELDANAAEFGIAYRVIDEPPPGCRYRGRPVLHDRRPRT